MIHKILLGGKENMKIQKSEQNWYMGYIFSREIDGNIIPQKVQNLVIRDYTQRQKKKFIYILKENSSG